MVGIEPKIIFEDEQILVLDKPAGMTVNRAETTKGEETIQDFVEKYLKISNLNPSASLRARSQIPNKSQIQNSNTKNDFEFWNRAGIVHRIDKETSGILLVAKTPEAFANLQQQFKERKVKKTYLALVHGKLEGEGEIRVPVGRLPWNRKRFGVVAQGREAATKYKVLSIMYYVLGKTKEQLTLLELYPETGRTHQIRVHLKYLGHPIFGDPLYAGRKVSRNDRKILPRVFLHASGISFHHPRTEELVSFESKLSDELQQLLNSLK